MERFKVGDRVYWSTDSRRIRATVLETNVLYEGMGLCPPRHDGIKVLIDEEDRKNCYGAPPCAAVEVWPGWSQRLRRETP